MSESVTLFEAMGGEPVIRQLVNDFYQIMDSEPEVAGIRAQHAPDLTEAQEKLFMFLMGWTGGPNLYIEKHGHPRLRARHLPFKIGMSERDQWLFCMWKALEKSSVAEEPQKLFKSAIYRLADHMRNQQES
jgi:hemoglobin